MPSSDVVQVPRQFVKEGTHRPQHLRLRHADVPDRRRRRWNSTRASAALSHHIRVPVEFVLGIYARETGQGMVFTEESSAVPPGQGGVGDDPGPEPTPPPPDKPRRPSLKVVK